MTDREDDLDPAEVIRETERRARERLQPDGNPVYIAASRALAGRRAALQLALAMLHRAMKEQPRFLDVARSPGALSTVICPKPDWGAEIATALRAMIDATLAGGTADVPSAPTSSPGKGASQARASLVDPLIFESTAIRPFEARHLRSATDAGRSAIVVLGDRAAALLPEVRVARVQTLMVPLPDAWTLLNFAFSSARNTAEQGGYAHPPVLSRLPQRLPDLMDLLTPVIVDLACGTGEGARALLMDLNRALRERRSELDAARASHAAPDTQHGMGDAGDAKTPMADPDQSNSPSSSLGASRCSSGTLPKE